MARKMSQLLIIVLMLLVSFGPAEAASLSGRILLQVEGKGEAWYVNPLNGQRYFLGRAADAAKIIRSLGLGVTNKDLAAWRGKAPARLSGRVLLQVESRGEAWYVNPLNLQLVSLGSPDSAFAIWNKLALGVSNKTLSAIVSASKTPIATESVVSSKGESEVGVPVATEAGREVFRWRYRGRDYYISLALDQKTYDSYAASSKVYSYYGELPDNWHDEYYKMFLQAKSGDNTIKDIVGQLKYIGAKEALSDDGLVELAMALVQSIPYDHGKNLQTGKPNYPYETLFRRLGVCSDKTFLAVMILRELGYGAAVIDLPAVNHAAVGIQCPDQWAVFNSGYCYAETTNYLPIGIIPQNFGTNGVVIQQSGASLGQFANVFKTSQLGSPQIVQKTKGKEYGGIKKTRDEVARLRQLELGLASARTEIDSLKASLDGQVLELNNLQAKMTSVKADVQQYNSLVTSYNQKVASYQALYERYKQSLENYNAQVASYNQGVENFYPSK